MAEMVPGRAESEVDALRARIQGNLRAARNSRQLSLRALSAATGVPPSVLHSLEDSERSELSLLRLVPVAEELGISLDDLARREPVRRSRGGRALEAFLKAHEEVTPAEEDLLRSIQWPMDLEPRTGRAWNLVLTSLQAAMEVGPPRSRPARKPRWSVDSAIANIPINAFRSEMMPVKIVGWINVMQRVGLDPWRQDFYIGEPPFPHTSRQIVMMFAEANSHAWARGPAVFLASEILASLDMRRSGNKMSGSDPFEDLEGLSSGLQEANRALFKGDVGGALHRLIQIRGVSLDRAASYLYILGGGKQLGGVVPLPYSRDAEQALVDMELLPDQKGTKKPRRYLNYLEVLVHEARRRGMAPEVLQYQLSQRPPRDDLEDPWRRSGVGPRPHQLARRVRDERRSEQGGQEN